ncbi:MAG: hypothetical protein HC920_14005 [Oscillatoriales cyanobacterium SM2_3_0]|nr:hypothetical protein [Oscillatoriales cyanobacterium SM2_3_0]
MFQRQDLLVLTSDDLMILSNRGLVKRAIKELESGHSYDLKVDEVGTIIVHWSDAIECILPTNVTLNQSYCSCAATTLCRHILKSVLAYQQTVHAQSSPQTVAGLSEPPSPNPDPLSPPEFSTWTTWNPGEISDTELAKYYRKPDLNRLQKSFNSGQVMELIQHQKPLAQFHSLPYTLRFLVPHDIRYTHCNCAEPAPCSHVPLAIWGFRLLPPGQTSGLVETATAALAIPVNLLDELERAVSDLVQTGLANCSTTLIGRFNRLISQCRAEGLVWPAEILGELLGERDRYLAHDARFSPIRVAELIGELCIRLDGIRANTGAIPQLLIRGSKADRVTEIGSARLIGLGCGIQIQYRHFKLSAYLQDADSGTLVNLGRDFSQGHSEADSPQPFAVLARTPVKRGIAWGDLGAGQLLTREVNSPPAMN